MHIADGKEVHQGTDDRDDHQHDGHQVIDHQSELELQGTDAGDIAPIDPGKLVLEDFIMITSQFRYKNNYRQEKTEEENTRSQPIPLARESLVEENQHEKPKQREKQDGGA